MTNRLTFALPVFSHWSDGRGQRSGSHGWASRGQPLGTAVGGESAGQTGAFRPFSQVLGASSVRGDSDRAELAGEHVGAETLGCWEASRWGPGPGSCVVCGCPRTCQAPMA